MPQKQPKRRRLWLNDGSCVRLRAAYRDHVWSYDFMHGRTHDGKAFRLLTTIGEYSRECLAIKVACRLTSEEGLDQLTQLFIQRHILDHIRHPTYAAHWLWAIAQALLLQNWIAGLAMLASFLSLYLLRVPREEEMMLEHFGEEYGSYMNRTGRVIPHLWGQCPPPAKSGEEACS